MSKLLQPIEIAKLFLVIREGCLDADNRHPLAKHLTVADMEKYNNYIEKFAESKRKESEYKTKI